jgi:hypothetical protein
MAAGKACMANNLRLEDIINKKRQAEKKNPLDEVVDIIMLPKFNPKATKKQVNATDIDLDKRVEAELHDYVTSISSMYHNNPFHNFEHAIHVTMSVVKLLSRIVAPIDVDVNETTATTNVTQLRAQYASTLHDHTYGITSDPLTQFACVFSALIHDVDHSGIPNSQLIAEDAPMSKLYQDKSIAEQNSVDLAWELLMDESYQHLRSVIYTNADEMHHFRQLVVNSVMATDIMDKDLSAQRKARWATAFADDQSHALSVQENINRKATIVIEHLIQASDVAHTMQHWHIYRKWNERLFTELYMAYRAGRGSKDLCEFWYRGEIGFFDYYIIPLAKKLKDCGMFGVSSDEYLQYAEKNRKEWEEKGEQIVNEMSERMRVEHGVGCHVAGDR